MIATPTYAQDWTSSTLLHICDNCPVSTWGQAWELGSAAFWSALAATHRPVSPALADSLEEELVACMLGGYGVPGDVGVASFTAVRQSGLLKGRGLDEIELAAALGAVLSSPFTVPGRSKPVTYRFWRQRPQRIAAALTMLRSWDDESWTQGDGKARMLRDRLLLLPGVGPKTASWVTRNYLDSDEVAIIDIHVARAGVAAGIFCRSWQVPRDYEKFEEAFLGWSRAGRVRASMLDATIWRTLADLGPQAAVLLGQGRATTTH